MVGLNFRGEHLFTEGVVAVLSFVAVAIRFYCKIRHKQGIRSDDWWILAALMWYWAAIGAIVWVIATGTGIMDMKDILAQSTGKETIMKQMRELLLVIYLTGKFYTTALFSIKMSVLCFYRRIFFIKDGYRRASMVLMAVAFAWYVATLVPSILICRPVNSFWIRTKTGKCLNLNYLSFGTSIADTVIDLTILLLPVRMAFKLQLPLKTRVGVAGIFALGGFVVITNIVRIIYIYQSHQKYVSFVQSERWGNIHMVTAIVCACMPIYKSLWSSFSTATSRIVGRYTISLRSVFVQSASKSQGKSYIHVGPSNENYASTSLCAHQRDLERNCPPLNWQGRSEATVTGGKESDQMATVVPKGSIARLREVHIA